MVVFHRRHTWESLQHSSPQLMSPVQQKQLPWLFHLRHKIKEGQRVSVAKGNSENRVLWYPAWINSYKNEFVIQFVGFCQSANWQHSNHTNSEEKDGDNCTMVSYLGVLNEGLKTNEERGVDGWCGSECDGVFHQQLSMSAYPPVPRPWGTVTCVS